MSITSIITETKARLVKAKPYIVGGAIGAVATVVVQFNAGWVVTTGTHEEGLAEARISAMANVCAQQAGAYWLGEGRMMTSLEGWSNDERDTLAQRFTPQLSDVDTKDVTRLCGRMLRRQA